MRKSTAHIAGLLFQSTPPARGATIEARERVTDLMISIHAPREGGDGVLGWSSDQVYISIHAPREGGDVVIDIRFKRHYNFNPRPPRGGRRRGCGGGVQVRTISIHAPREGGDCATGRSVFRRFRFQSTPPARGATTGIVLSLHTASISIHAPREGGDRANHGRAL